MSKSISFALLCAVSAFALGGCYTYPEPPVATTENSFFNRKTDKNDDLLRDIRSLSLETAQRIAVANNPNYMAVYHSVNSARMRLYQAYGAYSPTVAASFNIGQTHNWAGTTDDATVADYTRNFGTATNITANWLLFDGFARTLNVKIAKANKNYYADLDEDTCRTLLRAVAYAYNDILLAQENIRIAEKNMSFQMDCLRETELKHEVGTAALSDVLNFRIQVNNAENDQIVAETSYKVAVYVLAALMGYPDGTFPDWITFPEIDGRFADRLDTVEVYLDTALANRPDLRGYREKLKVAEYTSYKRTYSDYMPTVNAYGAWSYTTSRTSYSGASVDSRRRDYPGFEYGVNASWTLFNGFIRYNKMREAQADVANAKFTVASEWFGVVQEVRTSYALYARSVRQARLYEKTLLYSQQQRDLVAKEYEAGNVSITRLNEVQRDLVSAETTLASAYINIKNAKVKLDAAAGNNVEGFFVSPDARYQSQLDGDWKKKVGEDAATEKKADAETPADEKSAAKQ